MYKIDQFVCFAGDLYFVCSDCEKEKNAVCQTLLYTNNLLKCEAIFVSSIAGTRILHFPLLLLTCSNLSTPLTVCAPVSSWNHGPKSESAGRFIPVPDWEKRGGNLQSTWKVIFLSWTNCFFHKMCISSETRRVFLQSDSSCCMKRESCSFSCGTSALLLSRTWPCSKGAARIL